jgi:hypothetical protein
MDRLPAILWTARVDGKQIGPEFYAPDAIAALRYAEQRQAAHEGYGILYPGGALTVESGR